MQAISDPREIEIKIRDLFSFILPINSSSEFWGEVSFSESADRSTCPIEAIRSLYEGKTGRPECDAEDKENSYSIIPSPLNLHLARQ